MGRSSDRGNFVIADFGFRIADWQMRRRSEGVAQTKSGSRSDKRLLGNRVGVRNHGAC